MLATGILKSQVGKVLDIGLAFLVSVALTRTLGPEVYGRYILVLGWLGAAGLIISLGLSEAMNKFMPRSVAAGIAPQSFLRPLLLIRLGLAAVVGLAVLLLAPWLFAWLRHPDLSVHVTLMLVLFVFAQVAALFWSFFIAQLQIDTTIVGNSLRHLAVLAGVGVLSVQGRLSLRTTLFLVCVGYGLTLLYYGVHVLRGRVPGGARWPVTRLRKVLAFGVSAWGVSIVTFLLSEQTDVVLLGYLLVDTSSVAFYQVGTSLVWKLLGAITVGSQVVLATLVILSEREGRAGLVRGWQAFVKISTFTIVPCYVFLAWNAPTLIRLIYGDEFDFSATILRVFLVLMVLPFGLLGGGLNLMALYALGLERVGLRLRALSGVLNLVLAVVLIRRYGPLGAAVATGVATMVGTALELVALRSRQPLAYPWRFTFKILWAVAAGATVMAVVKAETPIALALQAMVYGAVMLVCLRVLRPLSSHDRSIVARISPRLATMTDFFTAPA